MIKIGYSSQKRRILVSLGVIGVVTIVVVVLILVFSLKSLRQDDSDSFNSAAVVSNGYLCAGIGRDVMVEGGNAVDAAIATLLCEGILNMQSMGIGGGFFMTIYTPEKGAIVLNARETAPKLATEDMYHGNASLSARGGLAIAVPGELRGYQEAFNKYGSGKISWERLFRPTIEICRNGFVLQTYLANIFKNNAAAILANPELREILVNSTTNDIYQAGDTIKIPKLGDTLEIIAKNGSDAFYNGTLTDTIVNEIKNAGGIIVREDLEKYQVQWLKPVTTQFAGNTFYSVPIPGSGVIAAFILNILENILPATDNVSTVKRIVEAFKFGYGKRTEFGDFSVPSYVPDANLIEQIIKNLTSKAYAKEISELIHDNETHQDPGYYGAVYDTPEDHGTAHISVIGPKGDAVAVTSTINLILGSQVVSPSTGIIFNDEMDDFSSPNITNAFNITPSAANFIRPGKRPLSSMCPSILVNDKGEVRLVTGAAGGSKITTAAAFVIVQNLLLNKSIKEAIDEPRVHHQLLPMRVDYEDGVAKDVINGLEKIGHITNNITPVGSQSTGLAVQNGRIFGAFDYRRGGAVAGF